MREDAISNFFSKIVKTKTSISNFFFASTVNNFVDGTQNDS